MDSVLLAFGFTVEALAVLIICQYDSLPSSRPSTTWPTAADARTYSPVSMACSLKVVPLFLRQQIFQKADSLKQNTLLEPVCQATLDPTPTTFVAAISVLTLAILFTHHLSQRHRLQNHFSVLGICAGIVISSTKAFIYPGLLTAASFRQILLWSWFLCSVSGAVAHRWIGGKMLEDGSEHADTSRIESDLRERKIRDLILENKQETG